MSHNQEAYLAAGCFWGIEAYFLQLKGIIETCVGFANGIIENPRYQDVLTDTTGFAETVYLKFDPDVIDYQQILTAFWQIHDPTTLNRQGPDMGTQYRSAIFYADEEQQQIAESLKEQLQASGRFAKPIVTSIEPLQNFYRAEEYHQRYFEKHGIACKIHTQTK